MARREIFVDDITKKEGDSVQERRYSIGHVQYTIDLSDDTYEQFLKALEPYVSESTVVLSSPKAPRAIRGAGATAVRSTVTPSGKTASDLKEWAKGEGHEVNDKGRLSLDVIGKWNDAHPDDKYVGKEALTGK